MNKYNPKKIEKKWQEKWAESGIYKNYDREKKFYVLDMFPYVSGSGIHVGHPKGYIATDVVARFKMLQGYSVLHPMGWDAFGLPAENYAIKNKINPSVFVKEHTKRFKKQLDMFGFTYDWDREINTTDPEYYKWTQWIFLKMFEKGLAHESNEPVNWCPSCKTVLANEDLEKGRCERCESQIVQKKVRQWVLKMTDYADRLLYDLDTEDLDWEEMIKEQQRNWIGKSDGTIIKFDVIARSEPTKQSLVGADNPEIATVVPNNSGLPRNDSVEVFTTRVDTIFGVTYLVVAPEHPILQNKELGITNYEEIEKYLIKAQNKTDLERMEMKEKTGVELNGIKAINPFSGEEVPIFVADYVLGHYGTGAVMAVPAHDERDFAFAQKYNLPIKKVIDSDKTYVVAIKRSLENNFYNEVGKFCQITENDGLVRIYSEEVDRVFELAGKNFIGEPWYIHSEGLIKKILFYTENKSKVFSWKDDYASAYQYGLSIGIKKEQLDWKSPYEATMDDGNLIDSGEYAGLSSSDAREKMTEWLEKNKLGKKKVNYKMRDWVFSRQRYWGEPIPIVHCEKCGAVGIPESELPLSLPEVENYEPAGTGESPLANITEWVNTTCPKCGGPARRETNTMPQWAGSCWYYLRYIDPKNTKAVIDKDKEKKWMPVDLYVGGAEHATRHLLYARFWHKFLFDIGVVSTSEPFKKLVHVGLINGEDGRKMSKRWGNVVNPDDVISEFGADAMRIFEMFMGPFSQEVAWSTAGVNGAKRFLEKVWKLNTRVIASEAKQSRLDANNAEIAAVVPSNSGLPRNDKILTLLHKTIKKVTEDIENFRFNTAISALMIMANEFEKQDQIYKIQYTKYLILLSPFAPHIAEELWQKMRTNADLTRTGTENNDTKYESIFLQKWSEHDPELVKDETIKLVIQVNGKVRDTIETAADIAEDDAKALALESEKIKAFLAGKEIKKVIFVPGRLMNLVI